MKQKITILGATGSIGKSTMDVLALHRDKFEVFALTANVQAQALFDLCNIWQPKYAVVRDEQAAQTFIALQKNAADKAAKSSAKQCKTQLLIGEAALMEVASAREVDVVVAAIVGTAGLASGLAAAQAGKRILLANKEALVMAGELFMRAIKDSGGCLLPIDSEHNAIFQCLPDDYICGQPLEHVNRILLTASGGPFRQRAIETLSSVTVEEACAHPNWDMGRKISVDSATMMNKGLELIEACHLFACRVQDIELLIHPQSIIHSMVEFCDQSVVAQMGSPDMRIPIAHALAWPQRFKSGVSALDFLANTRLEFEAVDYQRFPCLKLALDAAIQGQAASVVLNAANEVAVAAFLDKHITFTQIAQVIAATLQQIELQQLHNLQAVIQQDAAARTLAQVFVESHAA